MTLQENYNEFEIDLHNIWLFEQRSFGSVKRQMSSDFYKTILDKIASNFIIATEPFLVRQKETDVHNDYWIEKLAEYEHGLIHDNPFYNDLIYRPWGFYTYNSKVIVLPEDENFHLWFALVFRKYESVLSKLHKFLEYQLLVNFSSDFGKFKKFLLLVIRQYQDEIRSVNVILTCKEWIEEFTSLVEDDLNSKKAESPKREKSERTIVGHYNSFLFDKKRKELEAFLKDPIKLSDLKEDLSKNGFISRATNSKQLRRVFQNEIIDLNDRIIWAGTIIELQWFVNYFVHEMALVENPGNDIWLIAIKCFVNKDGNNYTISQLRDARGNNLIRKGLLYTILNRSFDT